MMKFNIKENNLGHYDDWFSKPGLHIDKRYLQSLKTDELADEINALDFWKLDHIYELIRRADCKCDGLMDEFVSVNNIEEIVYKAAEILDIKLD